MRSKRRFGKKIASFTIVLLILTGVFLSQMYLAEHSGHYCMEKDCPVCTCLAQCERFFRAVGNGIAGMLHIYGIVLLLWMILPQSGRFIVKDSPVRWKVRMND